MQDAEKIVPRGRMEFKLPSELEKGKGLSPGQIPYLYLLLIPQVKSPDQTAHLFAFLQ